MPGSLFAALLLSPAQTPEPAPADFASWQDFLSPGIAGLALLVSIFFGFHNRRTAQRALSISERQEARRETRVDLSLHEAKGWRWDDGAGRTLGVHFLATNPTDRTTSLVRAELHITYDADGLLTTVKVPPRALPSGNERPPNVADFRLPARLDANDAITGWVLFEVPEGLTAGYPISRYDFVVRDVHDIEERIQMSLFQEVRGAEAD